MGLDVGIVRSEVDSDDKDGGIDVAVWKPFPDKGPSFTSYLAQCTVQITYERKPADVVPDKWVAWIRFGKPPEIVLSVPFAIPLEAKIRSDLKYRVHVLLDRLRLLHSLELNPVRLDSFSEFDFMKDWTRREITATRNLLDGPSEKKPRRPKTRKPLRVSNPNAPAELRAS